jgi:hypothetical protein
VPHQKVSDRLLDRLLLSYVRPTNVGVVDSLVEEEEEVVLDEVVLEEEEEVLDEVEEVGLVVLVGVPVVEEVLVGRHQLAVRLLLAMELQDNTDQDEIDEMSAILSCTRCYDTLRQCSRHTTISYSHVVMKDVERFVSSFFLCVLCTLI